jgi:hypothetical protein
MTAALTIPGFDTKTRCDWLGIGFWFLAFDQQLLATWKLPKQITQKITAGNMATLCSSDQRRDGMNSFFSLIRLICTSPTSIALDRLGSGSLGHPF